MTIVLALASGLMWGAADYFGGSASRRRPVIVVVLISQFAGLLFALGTALVTGAFGDPPGYLWWSVLAGISGAVALNLYYQALAIGTMGVVSPIAALGVLVPVLIGLTTGALPSVLGLAGIVVAVLGVVATAGPSRAGADRKAGHARSIVLALGSAAGFGVVLSSIAKGAAVSPVMTMVTMRATSVPLLLLTAVLTVGRRGGTPLLPGRSLLGLIAVVGVLDVGANLLFGLATKHGALAVVAVLGSLYPAGTVLLARFLDHERLSRVQSAGVLAALAGVAMIAAGT